MEPWNPHGQGFFHTFHTFHTFFLMHTRTCVYARARACTHIIFSMEGMEVWKSQHG
jgi:hypothetical protein